MKCSVELTMTTDPQNSDSVFEAGAARNFELWHAEDEVLSLLVFIQDSCLYFLNILSCKLGFGCLYNLYVLCVIASLLLCTTSSPIYSLMQTIVFESCIDFYFHTCVVNNWKYVSSYFYGLIYL
ncbi:hypothetical protein RHGRI_002411 [Rhododendron griersonianum]|uniref:Uncharacterized protein n=1 Tax=Rhododendron griersonianum TaxID=479676 RepID=A0AAV6LQ64_9ERIC|nr:hypothetical protein RHGRI_002411 [Rhododendron griersonianum]